MDKYEIARKVLNIYSMDKLLKLLSETMTEIKATINRDIYEVYDKYPNLNKIAHELNFQNIDEMVLYYIGLRLRN